MIETILAATDLSERSDVALRRAVERAEALGAALHIACVVDDVMPHDMCETLCTEARARLEAFVASLGGAEPPVLHIRIGDPLAVIHAIADKIRADLLVFGVHRSRPFLDLVSATTMERLVRGGPRPVLVVRDAADAPYGQVLAGLDVSPASAAAIRLAATVAPGAEINGFHAVHIPARRLTAPEGTEAEMRPYLDAAAEELAGWAAEADLPEAFVMPEPVGMGRTTALQHAMRLKKPDLLAIGAHGRPAFSPHRLGSFTAELLRDPPCDVLVARR